MTARYIGLYSVAFLLQFPEAKIYRRHDIRRGHADDLRASGAPLAKILLWGEWSSPAFLDYMELEELEAGMVLEGHLDDSSSEEEDRPSISMWSKSLGLPVLAALG